jgi:kexin
MRWQACLCLCVALTQAARPMKRDYAANEYYVLELDSASLAEARAVAASLGALLVEQVGELKGHYLLAAPKHADHVYAKLRRKRSLSTRIRSLERQTLRQRVKRVVPALEPRQAGVSRYLQDIVKRFSIADPLFVRQWHLANDQMVENSINVTGVWAQNITGYGVKVAIVDDGLDSQSRSLFCRFS